MRTLMLKMVVYLAIFISSAMTVGCGSNEKVVSHENRSNKSTLDSVDIVQTSVRNQFQVGFCWSYALMGMLESRYSLQTGISIDLSEEAIGIYRMAAELQPLIEATRRGRFSKEQLTRHLLDTSKLEGWFVKNESVSLDGMRLVETFGVVPESVWSYKFDDAGSSLSLRRGANNAMLALVDSNETLSIRKVAKIFVHNQGLPSLPPEQFQFQGRVVTSTELAREIFGFSASNYVNVSARTAEDARKVLTAIKRANAAGYSVPIGFTFDASRLSRGILSAPIETMQELSAAALRRDLFSSSAGGHAVLVTDFVNEGGREGAMSRAELTDEVQKPLEELSYLKLKNSWGMTAAYNERGIPVSGGREGYLQMDLGYLLRTAAGGHFVATVPVDIANSLESDPVLIDTRVVTE